MTPAMSRREEYAALTRAALLEAAEERFVHPGFDATSVDDIATAARVSKGAVYHHFPDKRAIFDEVFRACQQEVMGRVQDTVALAGSSSPWAVTQTAVQTFLRAFEADAGKRALLRQAATVLGVERCRQIDDELALPQILFLLRAAEERGELAPVPHTATAGILFGMLCEAATSVAFAADPAQACRDAELVVVQLLSGLRREGSGTAAG